MNSAFRIGMAVGLALAAAPSLVFAQTVNVDGFVRNSSGVGVADVDLDWFNRDTDTEVDPTGDHTTATGYFAVVLPEGRYDITVKPPAGAGYAPVQLLDVDLRDSQTVDDIIIPNGAALSAHVQNGSGTALPGMKITMYDERIDDFVYVDDDRTGPTGDFSSLVPVGEFTFNVLDPDGVYGPEGIELDITGDADLGTFVLNNAGTINGHVQDPSSNPVFNVDVTVLDESTRAALFTAARSTDLFGNFSTRLSSGSYEFLYVPSTGSPFAPKRVRNVPISGSTTLPTVVLPTARTVTGTVLNDVGAAFENVDVNVFDTVTDDQLHTPDDNTTASGMFSIVVGSGVYDFTFNPPPGSGFAAGVLRDVSISAATSLGTIALVRGVRISGVVTGSGSPIANVDFDAIVPATGDTYPTPGDDTDTSGMYEFRLPAGTYELVVTPPPGSGYAPKTLAASSYTVDTVLNIELETAVSVPSASDAVGPSLLLAPNPFRAGVHLSVDRFDAPSDAPMTVSVFDTQGRLVREFATQAGTLNGAGVVWDGRGRDRAPVAPGTYFFTLRVGDASVTSKAVLVR